MHMRSAARTLAPITLLVSLAVLSLWGCTGSSDDISPATRRLINSVGDDLRDRIADMQVDVDDAKDVLTELQERIDSLEQQGPATGGAPPAEIAQLRANNQELRQQLNDLQDRVNALIQAQEAHAQPGVTVAEMSGQPVRGPGEEVSSSAAGAVDSAGGEQSAAPDRQRGFYHTLGPDETLEQVAARYGIELSALLSANGLPRNASFPPGQDIFIPQR